MLSRTLLICAAVAGCISARPIDQAAIEPFLTAAAARPEFVGAGLIDGGTRLLVTVYGDTVGISGLAREMLPAGTLFEVRALDHSLEELQALADRIVAEKMTPPNHDLNITEVDVDELRGVVVIGVAVLDGDTGQALTTLYGSLVVVEQRPRGTLL